MLVRPRVMGEKTLALDRKPRHFPFQFEATSRETDVYEIELPKEYVVDDVPEPVNVDMGFGAYHSKIEVDGRSLHNVEEHRRQNLTQNHRRNNKGHRFTQIPPGKNGSSGNGDGNPVSSRGKSVVVIRRGC